MCSPRPTSAYSRPSLSKALIEELKKLGRKGQLKVGSERRETGGGFILSDGGADIMCTYEALMSEARAGIEGDVLKLLFPEQ